MTEKGEYEGVKVRDAYKISLMSMKRNFPGHHYTPYKRRMMRRDNSNFQYTIQSYGQVYDDIVAAFIAGTTSAERTAALGVAHNFRAINSFLT